MSVYTVQANTLIEMSKEKEPGCIRTVTSPDGAEFKHKLIKCEEIHQRIGTPSIFILEYKVIQHSRILGVETLDWSGEFKVIQGTIPTRSAVKWTQTFKKTVDDQYGPLYEALNKSMQPLLLQFKGAVNKLYEEELKAEEAKKAKPQLDHNPSFPTKEDEEYYTREKNMHEKYFWQY